MIFYGNRGNFPCVEGNVKVMPIYAYAMGAERTLCPKAGDVSKWRKLRDKKGKDYADAWFETRYEKQIKTLGFGGILEAITESCGSARVASSRTNHAFLEDSGQDDPQCGEIIAEYLRSVGLDVQRVNGKDRDLSYEKV